MLTHDEILQLGNMLSETFKQMATLDAAILVLIVTIVEKVFTPQEFIGGNRPKTWLLLASLFAFIVSLAASLWALLSIPGSTVSMLEGGNATTWVANWAFYVSMGSFTVGIFVFIVLACISFLTAAEKRTHLAVLG